MIVDATAEYRHNTPPTLPLALKAAHHASVHRQAGGQGVEKIVVFLLFPPIVSSSGNPNTCWASGRTGRPALVIIHPMEPLAPYAHNRVASAMPWAPPCPAPASGHGMHNQNRPWTASRQTQNHFYQAADDHPIVANIIYQRIQELSKTRPTR